MRKTLLERAVMFGRNVGTGHMPVFLTIFCLLSLGIASVASSQDADFRERLRQRLRGPQAAVPSQSQAKHVSPSIPTEWKSFALKTNFTCRDLRPSSSYTHTFDCTDGKIDLACGANEKLVPNTRYLACLPTEGPTEIDANGRIEGKFKTPENPTLLLVQKSSSAELWGIMDIFPCRADDYDGLKTALGKKYGPSEYGDYSRLFMKMQDALSRTKLLEFYENPTEYVVWQNKQRALLLAPDHLQGIMSCATVLMERAPWQSIMQEMEAASLRYKEAQDLKQEIENLKALEDKRRAEENAEKYLQGQTPSSEPSVPAGIGATIKMVDNYPVIESLVAGGPAAQDGHLQVGDRITGLAQGNEAFEATEGMRLSEVWFRIRGHLGSTVRVMVSRPGNHGRRISIIVLLVRQALSNISSATGAPAAEATPKANMPSLSVEALMNAAEVARNAKDYKREVDLRSWVAADFPLVKEAPEQLYQAAQVMEDDLKDIDGAIKLYQEVATKFPNTQQGRKAADRANKL